eukprot:3065196-Lingulodinium_polyedra.AAC.1
MGYYQFVGCEDTGIVGIRDKYCTGLTKPMPVVGIIPWAKRGEYELVDNWTEKDAKVREGQSGLVIPICRQFKAAKESGVVAPKASAYVRAKASGGKVPPLQDALPAEVPGMADQGLG